MVLRYHLKNWKYFIELACFIPSQMTDILSNSLKLINIGISGTAFARITAAAKCAKTVEGLETIMLLVLRDYVEKDVIDKDPLFFDKFLQNIDEQLIGLKEAWAEYHSFEKGEE